MTPALPAFDPRDPGFRTRPDFHELTARLRAESPVHEVDDGLKVVSRHADIREISRDPSRFVNGRGILVNDPLRQGRRSIEGSILHMDPPQHAEWRRLLNRRFTPRAVTPLTERIREMTVALLDDVPPGEVVDAVDVLCAPLPVLVIAELLGVPSEDRDDFRRWSDAAIAATDGVSELSESDVAAMGELGAYLDAHAKAMAADPGDDLVSALVGSEVQGRPMTAGELVLFSITLLVAGNETTRHLLAGSLTVLSHHPDQRAALAAAPAGVPLAVEECLRWVTPIHQFARTVVADTEVGGRPVAADDYLIMLYASGNRDEAAFGPTADRFDATRQPSVPNLGFGFGEHLCLGAALARLEGRVVLEEVLARFPDYELAEEPVVAPSSLVHGPEHLAIAF